MRRTLSTILLILASATLAGCSVNDLPFVHKVPVQQGNIITDDMVDELEPGMTRSQVEYVLGSPAIEDIFRTDRWDYVHTERDGGGGDADRLTVFFEEDRLVRLEGNLAPDDFGS